jgi:hypothetical protein
MDQHYHMLFIANSKMNAGTMKFDESLTPIGFSKQEINVMQYLKSSLDFQSYVEWINNTKSQRTAEVKAVDEYLSGLIEGIKKAINMMIQGDWNPVYHYQTHHPELYAPDKSVAEHKIRQFSKAIELRKKVVDGNEIPKPMSVGTRVHWNQRIGLSNRGTIFGIDRPIVRGEHPYLTYDYKIKTDDWDLIALHGDYLSTENKK